MPRSSSRSGKSDGASSRPRADLHRHLPDRRRADVDTFGRFDRRARLRIEACRCPRGTRRRHACRAAGSRLDRLRDAVLEFALDLRVDAHRSPAGSGSGPSARPKTRFGRSATYGTSFAMGLPARPMTISSPASARSSRRERLRLGRVDVHDLARHGLSLARLTTAVSRSASVALDSPTTSCRRWCGCPTATAVSLEVARTIRRHPTRPRSRSRQPRSRWTLMTSLRFSMRLMTRASCDTEWTWSVAVTTAV